MRLRDMIDRAEAGDASHLNEFIRSVLENRVDPEAVKTAYDQALYRKLLEMLEERTKEDLWHRVVSELNMRVQPGFLAAVIKRGSR